MPKNGLIWFSQFFIADTIKLGHDLKYPAIRALHKVDKLRDPNAPWRNFMHSIAINCCRLAFASRRGSDSLVTYILVVRYLFALRTGLNSSFLCLVHSLFVSNAVQSSSHNLPTDISIVFELSGHICAVLCWLDIKGKLGNSP